MCGICGIFGDRAIADPEINIMTDTLAHRGPDSQGIFLSETRQYALGHRRLSIIDLDSGKQPMSDAEGKVWITFNGEIYNYKEIRNTLQNRYPFRTNSDTEVIIYLYREFGYDCLQYLRGMFAFAILDLDKNLIFAARDHLGQKPFFYHQDHSSFVFASEIKSILALRPDLRQLDPQALFEYLTLRIITPPRSMFRNIRKLPPAHYLVYHNHKLSIEKYWALQYEPKYTFKEADLLNRLDHEIEQSVKYHMVSDVPVGAFLSGGLDSSLVTSKMCALSTDTIASFSGHIPYENFSESHYARLVAHRYATNHHELTIMPSLIQSLPDVVWHLDEPSDSLSICLYSLSELTRRHVKVVLGGDGGDELFGGYDRYFGYLMTSLYAFLPSRIRRDIFGRIISKLPDVFWYRSINHQIKWMHLLSFYQGGTRYAKSLSYFYFFSDEFKSKLYTKDFIESVGIFDPEAIIRHYFGCQNAKDPIDKMLYADSMTRMPDHPNMILDRMTMAHGLESRSPFLDHKLAEFCARIPSHYKIRGRQLRYIQTLLAARYLPRENITRTKQGFASALPYILKDEFLSLYQAFLMDSHLVSNGILRGKAIASLLDEHLSKKRDHAQRLWLICNSEIWYRMFIENQSVEEIQTLLRQNSHHL
jgi:asparagine synthase (glutamine-hydrolysing)